MKEKARRYAFPRNSYANKAMKEQTLVITISPEGNITADAEGFSGDTCLRELDKLLAGLSPGSASVDRKPDAGRTQIKQAKQQDLGRNS